MGKNLKMTSMGVRPYKFAFLSKILMVIVCLSLTLLTGCGKFGVGNKPTSGEIYTSVSPSVFFLSVELDGGGKAGGSAFFIDNKGTAVTNYHVIEGGVSATATLSDGQEYEVTKVLGKDKESDIVIIKVDIDKSKPVKIANSSNVKTGDKVYAIGYPEAFKVGIENSTFTDGIVSKNSFFIEGTQYIQTNVDITHGNSGGVLLNDEGEVIGITTAKIDISGADYMNLALPSNNIYRIDKTEYNCSLRDFTLMKKKFSVNFMNEGELYATQSILMGEFAGEVKITNGKKGYRFIGWSVNEGSTELFDFTTPITESLTLYAVWQANTYGVAFVCEDDGVTGETQGFTATYDTAFTLPECGFIRDGYHFKGWKYAGRLYQVGERAINLTDKQGERVTFTPEWVRIISYTVQFKNTLSGAEGELPQDIKATTGIPFKLPTANLKGRGFRFVGWEYNGRSFELGEEVDALTDIPDGVVIISTRWERINYTVTFDYNLPEYYKNTTTTIAYGQVLELPHIFKSEYHDGYDFEGWYYDGTLYNENFSIHNFYSESESVTISARWTPHTYYLTYIYMISDYEFETKSEEITYGTGYTLRTEIDGFTKEGYKIVGWECGGKTLTAGEKFPPVKENNTSFELYAQFGEITFNYIFLDPYGNEYIDYDNNNSKGTCRYGEDFTRNIRPYFRYHPSHLAVTYKLLDENKNVYTGDPRYICKTDGATVYVLPDWQEGRYHVRFSNVDPTTTNLKVELITVSYFEVFELPELSKPGFVFKGWKWGTHLGEVEDSPIFPAGTEFSQLEGQLVMNSYNMAIFYAVWEAYSYTIHFDGDGAQLGVMPDLLSHSNENITLTKNTFKKSGYVFCGWIWQGVILDDGVNFVYTPATSGVVITFTAYWVAPLDGKGTEESPYLISSYQDLYDVSFLMQYLTGADAAYYSLTCDIDCGGRALYPIGTQEKPLKGVFLGNQHKIINPLFKAAYGKQVAGLFGYVNGGKITAVGIEGYSISATQGDFCAPLVCSYVSERALENCYAKGKIDISITSEKSIRAGGLVGFLQADIKNCRAEGEISFVSDYVSEYTLDFYLGGMISVYYSSSIIGDSTFLAENCYADVDIKIYKKACKTIPRIYAGGLVGNTGKHTFKNCVAKGDLYSEVGGIFYTRGRFVGGDYMTSYANCKVSADASVEIAGSAEQLPTGVTEVAEASLISLEYLAEELGFDRTLWKEKDGKIYLSWEV